MNSRYQCSDCSKSFRRLEHLNRHRRSHAQHWNFHCSLCHKAFYRRDALERHEIAHSSESLLRIGARACRNCAAAKSKCSADLPCERCVKQSLDCHYAADVPQNARSASNQSQPQERNQTDVVDIRSDEPEPWRLDNNLELGVGRLNPSADAVPGANRAGLAWSPHALTGMEQDSSYVPPNVLSSVNWLSGETLWDPSMGVLSEWPEMDMVNDPLLSLLDVQSPAQLSSFLGSIHSCDSPSNVAEPPTAAGEPLVTSPASATSSRKTLYVDGDKTRLPRVKRRRILSSAGQRFRTRTEPIWFDFPTFNLPDGFDVGLGKNIHLPQNVYNTMYDAFGIFCRESTNRPFLSGNFPSLADLQILAKKGLASLAQHLPFLHIVTLREEPGMIWNLFGALAGIGAQYTDAEWSHQFANAMHEFIRRSLRDQPDDRYLIGDSRVQLKQTKVTNCLGLMYSGEIELLERGKECHHSITMICDSAHFDTIEEDQSPSHESPDAQWMKWVRHETKIRLRFTVWLLDCLWNVHFQMKPLLGLQDANMQLPCAENLWIAETADLWNAARQDSIATSTGTLLQLLQNLYIKKFLPPRISDFNQILLIHAVFHRTWEVEQYVRQSLGLWDPSSDNDNETLHLEVTAPIWPPSRPTYAKWRNAACDCLDVMHWRANATIEMTGGNESPVVLHLHLARVVLLAPVQSMIDFAKLVGRPDSRQSHANGRRDRMVIHRWATQDQYKARLAIIHAGVLFWHIRRFSKSAFYEPSAIALATLTLWSYSCYADRSTESRVGRSRTETPDGSQENSRNEKQADSDDSDSSIPPLMNIDRPADDELVQLFVRQGSRIRANVTGVGDILGPHAPKRILSQGQKLLRLTKSWELSRVWTETLECLKG